MLKKLHYLKNLENSRVGIFYVLSNSCHIISALSGRNIRSVDYLYIKYKNTKYAIFSIHKFIQKIMNKGPNIMAVSRNKNNSPIPFYLICPLISPAFFTKNSVISSNDSLSKTVVGSKSAAHTSTPDRSTSSD